MMLAVLLSGTVSGCGQASLSDVCPQNGDKISVICTTFPLYDWVRQLIAGREDAFCLTLLLDDGSEMHSYQPTASDMMAIAACDVFFYVGGESDIWVEDALQEAVNEEMRSVGLMETMGDRVLAEETVEGMEERGILSHGHATEGDEDEAYDEHIWLSLVNARILIREMAATLAAADEAYASLYLANASRYDAQLAALDEAYAEVVAGAARKTLLFGDRFPFRYLVEDYGLSYYAAFEGCSAETEASFRTIAFLAKKVTDLSLPAVLVLENSNPSVARAIMNNASKDGVRLLTLHSMQSVSAEEIAQGCTYLSFMEDNLKILEQALR